MLHLAVVRSHFFCSPLLTMPKVSLRDISKRVDTRIQKRYGVIQPVTLNINYVLKEVTKDEKASYTTICSS